MEWTAMELKRKNFDRFVRGKLLSLPDSLRFKSGEAKDLFTKRSGELSSETLQLIVSSHPKTAVLVNALWELGNLPEEQVTNLISLADVGTVEFLIMHSEKDPIKKDIIKHLDILKKNHKGTLLGQNNWIHFLLANEANAFEEYKSVGAMQEHILTHKKCPTKIVLEILAKNPKLSTCYNIREVIQNHNLKLVSKEQYDAIKSKV